MLQRLVFICIFAFGLACAQAILNPAAVDITLNLEGAGFECSGMEPLGEEVWWNCSDSSSDYEFSAEVIGSGPSSIGVVQATGLNFLSASTLNVVGPYLGYIATFPYEGANPEEARDWGLTNFDNHEAPTTIGGVTITIFANAERARILRMEKLP